MEKKFNFKNSPALILAIAFLIVFGLTKLFENANKNQEQNQLTTDQSVVEIKEETIENTTQEEILASGKNASDFIILDLPQKNTVNESPIKITGKARGYWFFEANFPILVTNWDGLIIGEGFATADGEWMTEEFVPFTAEINYNLPADSYSENGTLILQKANASGEPEFDDALEIPIKLVKSLN